MKIFSLHHLMQKQILQPLSAKTSNPPSPRKTPPSPHGGKSTRRSGKRKTKQSRKPHGKQLPWGLFYPSPHETNASCTNHTVITPEHSYTFQPGNPIVFQWRQSQGAHQKSPALQKNRSCDRKRKISAKPLQTDFFCAILQDGKNSAAGGALSGCGAGERPIRSAGML